MSLIAPVLVASALAALAAPAAAATLVVNVQQRDGKPVDGAVIEVHARDGKRPNPAPVRAIVDQLNLEFVPALIVIPVGSTVEFPNSDTVSHQVYSFSPTRRFQLPLYRGKPYPPVLFDQPGVVTLGCNIHDNMLAYVVVTDAPYFGRANDTGAWSVANLPPGDYGIRIWHPQMGSPSEFIERTASVAADDRVQIDIKLERALRPAPLVNRPKSWDAY